MSAPLNRRIAAAIEWVISRPVVVRWACRNDRRQSGRAAPRFEAASARLTASGDPLDGGAVLRLWQAVKEPTTQPFEVEPGEWFVHVPTGRTWRFDGDNFRPMP
jgi:hypothetical protein